MTGSQVRLSELHGGEVEWAVSERFNIPITEIISFASTVSPIIPESLGSLSRKFSQFHLYPSRDHSKLKQAIGRHHGLRKNDAMILGCGSTELIHLFAQVSCNGEAIIPIPTYGEYETAVCRYGGKAGSVTATEELGIDIEGIERAISAKTKAIFLCNPNNPTGRLYAKPQLEQLASVAKENNIILVVDEAYMSFAPESKIYSMGSLVDSYPVLVLGSLSKLFGIPSLRLGWGIGSHSLVNRLESWKIPWTIGNLAIWAAEELLPDVAYQSRIKNLIASQRIALTERLGRIPWLKLTPTDCNFILVKILENRITSTDIFEQLLKKGLVIRDCSSIRGLGDEFFRVTIRTPTDNEKLVSALIEIPVPAIAPQR